MGRFSARTPYVLIDDEGEIIDEYKTPAEAEADAWHDLVSLEVEGNGELGELLVRIPETEDGAYLIADIIGLIRSRLDR